MSVNEAGVVRLTTAGLKARLDQGEPIALLDVREPEERAFCAIGGFATATDLHIPMNEIPTRLVEVRAAAEGKTLVVYCHHGVRSLAVAHWLTGQGVRDVANLDGGIDVWSAVIDPDVPRY
ncbi:MAG: rhodanese-like domain-containing protein [Isosphaeraceae bacterium]